MHVPFVQRIKRPNGRIDLYFRRKDHREGPLVSTDGTPELKAEVEAIIKRLEQSSKAQAKPKAGTIGGMLRAYNKSSEFLGLARITQINYQGYIDEMIADIGDVQLRDVTRSWIIELRDAWAPGGHNGTNKRMQVLRNALAPAIDDETDQRITSDPFLKVKAVKRPHGAGEAHPIWEDAEVEVTIDEFLRRDLPGLARAVALGRWGGFRRGTICAVPLYARSEGRLRWLTEKREVLCDKREDRRLTGLIERTPNRALTIAYNGRNAPLKPRQFHQAMERVLDHLAREGKVRGVLDTDGKMACPLTIHGLRHSRGVELALAGSSDAEIMSQLEQATSASAKIYRRQAERRKLADAGQDRIDNLLNLRDHGERTKEKQRL